MLRDDGPRDPSRAAASHRFTMRHALGQPVRLIRRIEPSEAPAPELPVPDRSIQINQSECGQQRRVHEVREMRTRIDVRGETSPSLPQLHIRERSDVLHRVVREVFD